MLVLFANDIVFAMLGRKAASFTTILYDEIPARLPGLAQSLKSRASDDEIGAVLANPLTLRLEGEADLVFPSAILKDVSACLDLAFGKFLKDGRCPVTWIDDTSVAITLPGLSEVLKSHGLTDDRAPESAMIRMLRRAKIMREPPWISRKGIHAPAMTG